MTASQVTSMFGKLIPRICIIFRSIMGLHREVFTRILVDSGSRHFFEDYLGVIPEYSDLHEGLMERNHRQEAVRTECCRCLTDSTRLRMFSRLKLVSIGAIKRTRHL